MLDITISENERSEHFQTANFTVPFFSGTERKGMEQNGKNAFTLSPRTIAER